MLGNVLILEFRRLLPPVERQTRWRGRVETYLFQDAECELLVACPWLLQTPDRMLVGEDDERNRVVELFELERVLDGKRLLRSEMAEPSFMLWLHFEGDLTLWAFPINATAYDPTDHNHSCAWFVLEYPFPDESEDEDASSG